MVNREQKDLMVWAVSDPVEAVRGADFIVTTLHVGGDSSRGIDETVTLNLRVIGQETTGAGAAQSRIFQDHRNL